MKIAMAQMAIGSDIAKNLEKSVGFVREAALRGADLIFFPELQLTPFYPLHRLNHWAADPHELAFAYDSPQVGALRQAAQEAGVWVSPNFYLQDREGQLRDMNLVFNPAGELACEAAMVHVMGVEDFWETDYYAPAADGFKVFDTGKGRVGIVICFDRHMPESIRSCALQGAELIIIPTVNMQSEPMEMFMQELRVQAFQNNVFIAMCNRVGQQDHAHYAGQSLIIDPEGDVIFKADDSEQLIVHELELSRVAQTRAKRPYLSTRRPSEYYL